MLYSQICHNYSSACAENITLSVNNFVKICEMNFQYNVSAGKEYIMKYFPQKLSAELFLGKSHWSIS